MPPCDSSFRMTPERPLITVTMAPMTCRLAIGSDRLTRRTLAPSTVGFLPAGLELQMEGHSPVWALLIELDTGVAGMEAVAAFSANTDLDIAFQGFIIEPQLRTTFLDTFGRGSFLRAELGPLFATEALHDYF